VLYASGLITLTAQGYTKHYFTEGTRVCSKIGGGFNGNANNNIFNNSVSLITSTYQDRFDTAEVAIDETFDGCMKQSVVVKYKWNLCNMMDAYAPLNNYEPAFFYHSDHLGSSSYITDKGGNVTQTFAYLPYGEQWVDVSYQNPAFATTYKFSGKEKDEETGFGYFGARYYYDYLSIWLSTDPHADKYPSLSPYVYCANNPIKFIDPNGMDIDPSKMTQAQQEKFNSAVKTAKENSDLFKQVYETLDKSNIKFTVEIGETVKDESGSQVPGQYNVSNQTITFRDEDVFKTPDAFAEEFFHAYQRTENASLYDKSSFNYEFEAKAFVLLSKVGYNIGAFYNMNDFSDLLGEKYDFGDSFNSNAVNSPEFLNEYNRQANEYSTFNKRTNYGNKNYQVPTKQTPKSLMRVVNEARR
jgi:RHS repeat-associated protein